MLPAPRTIPISTPRSWTVLIWAATAFSRSGSVPYSSEPIRDSPESFSRIRLKTGPSPPTEAESLLGGDRLQPRGELGYERTPSGSADSPSLRRWVRLVADLEAREAADDHVLSGLRAELCPKLLDRLAVVLVGVDVLLVEQHDLLHPLAQLALGDLWAHVLGLVGGLLLEDAQLSLLRLLRDFVL